MKLTVKQKLFADEYIKSGNATQSAIKAGYAPKAAYRTGAENLRKPQIKSYIDAKMAEIESSKIADAKEVLEFYARVLREEETEEVALATGDDVVTVRKKPSMKDKIAVAKEIMKRYPAEDLKMAAEIKRLSAEAKIAEWKASELTGTNQSEDKTTLVDDIGGMDDGQDD
ncbi:terminase small subunit [Lactobacillus alvi]|uniref:Terminase small subunit n=1 Tax=Limosilactobacillus alvi TaxID=990412 RepID=A0ABS2ENV0_9LACO|nr:terminase small subunit [Limosilactobacillus alvi]MBM6754167.1 terminase small subunit [Limosilactobacillus alvi]